MPPRAFPMGHRNRGAGYTVDNRYDIERADVLSLHKSRTWYVDSNVAGAVSGSGVSWGDALLTVAAAITLAVNDDIIMVAPGHTENLATAAAIAVSKSVTIVGVGRGRRRPTFTFITLTTATITVTASSVWIENCVFICGIDAQVTMFAVTADDCTFAGCEFDIGNATNQTLLGITVTGVDRFRMYNCHVHGTIDAGCTNFVQIVGSAGKQKDYEFVGNTIIGAFTTTLGAINNITVAMVNCVIRDNMLINLTASATKVVVLLTGSTAAIFNNRVGIGSGAAPFSADAGWWAGNWSAAAVATNGTLV